MSSTSSGVGRARWGQARLELAINYAQIKKTIKTSPSYRAAFVQLQKDGLITVKYDAFIRSWKMIRDEKEKPKAKVRPAVKSELAVTKSDGKSAGKPKRKLARKPGSKPTRKPLPTIRGFSVPTGDKGVKELW